LLDVVRGRVDDSMLREIARADYGCGADEAFVGLRSIRDEGVVPAETSGELGEVLALTRWCSPEQPNPPPFEPGPSGSRGHLIRLFACAVLLRASSDPTSLRDDAEDATLAICLVSARVCGDEFDQALGRFLTWQFPSSKQPVYVALALLTLACRSDSKGASEPELNHIAEWVLAEDESRRADRGTFDPTNPRPAGFGLQQGFWHSLAVELRAKASYLTDPKTRENVELCSLLLDPN
jgi:hypothetical protein